MLQRPEKATDIDVNDIAVSNALPLKTFITLSGSRLAHGALPMDRLTSRFSSRPLPLFHEGTLT